MKFKLALFTIVLLTAAAVSQEKPNVEQCRADLNVWKSTNAPETDTLGVRELQRRFGEMTSCSEAEASDWERRARYLIVSEIYGDAISARYLKFLIRHQLLQQFLDEDAAGQR
jgi:hypothetical protein